MPGPVRVGKAFCSPAASPPPKTASRPQKRAGERHRLNVLVGKTFGEMSPRLASPVIAGVSRAGMRGENLAGKGLERRGLQRLRACACLCLCLCAQLLGSEEELLKTLGQQEGWIGRGRKREG